jgi:hypothetical protein
MVTRTLRKKQTCTRCGMKCAAFTNLRFVDCDFTIVAERGTHQNLFMKKGSTP